MNGREGGARSACCSRTLAASAFVMLAASALSGCYVAHLAKGQLRLVNDQKPLAQAIQEEPDPMRKLLLAEVPYITHFAEHVIRLKKSDSYVGYYATERDWLTLIVSAAPKDALVPYTRWYPVAGRVPYRSFFDESRARRAQAELEQAGYDTFLHRSPAYSTLGFFRDPVTTPMLDRRLPCPPPTDLNALDGCRLASLAETLIHELTHQHLYLKGKTDFNEQLASFVGRTGAIQYLVYRGLYDEALRSRLQVAFDRQQRFEDGVGSAVRELEALYRSPVPRATKLAQREPIFERIAQLARTSFPDSAHDDFRVNNARVLQYVRYNRRADTFSQLYRQADGRWLRFWRLVQRAATSTSAARARLSTRAKLVASRSNPVGLRAQ